jgi:hypothetical protein
MVLLMLSGLHSGPVDGGMIWQVAGIPHAPVVGPFTLIRI